MLKAIALGTLAQSALLLSGLLVYWIHFPPKFVGILAGFGAGALIEAVAFDLVAEAQALDSLQFAVWMLVGAAILLIGDAIVDRRFGDAEGRWGSWSAQWWMAFLSPRSSGSKSRPGFRSASVSSPRSSSPTSRRRSRPPPISRRRDGRWVGLVGMWAVVLVFCGFASGLGYLLADTFSGVAGDRMAALAAGGLLAMLTNSLMPFAFERGGQLAGVGTVLGFCIPLMF